MSYLWITCGLLVFDNADEFAPRIALSLGEMTLTPCSVAERIVRVSNKAEKTFQNLVCPFNIVLVHGCAKCDTQLIKCPLSKCRVFVHRFHTNQVRASHATLELDEFTVCVPVRGIHVSVDAGWGVWMLEKDLRWSIFWNMPWTTSSSSPRDDSYQLRNFRTFGQRRACIGRIEHLDGQTFAKVCLRVFWKLGFQF